MFIILRNYNSARNIFPWIDMQHNRYISKIHTFQPIFASFFLISRPRFSQAFHKGKEQKNKNRRFPAMKNEKKNLPEIM